jgi:hypothetical protein
MDQSLRQQVGWSPGQAILNDTGSREPEHRLDPPVPVVARIVWEDDGEEYIETEAAGCSWRLVSAVAGQAVSVDVGVAGRGGPAAALYA